MVGAEGVKNFDFDKQDCWKRHFLEKNYIKNYFYIPKITKSTKTTCQKCGRNIWADFFGHPYCTNSITTHLGSPVVGQVIKCFQEILDIYLSRYVLVFDRQPFLFYSKDNFHFVEN